MARRWTAPPNWPQPPRGWEPTAGWRPDPAWGPAPAGWVFYQEDATRPGADGELVCGRGTDRKAAKLSARFAPHLGPGEKLTGLFVVNSFRPLLTILAVTTDRLLFAGDDLAQRGPRIELVLRDLDGFALPRGFTGVKVVRTGDDGQPASICTLGHERDAEPLAALVSALITSAGGVPPMHRPVEPEPPSTRTTPAPPPAPTEQHDSVEAPKLTREERVALIEHRAGELLDQAAVRAADGDVLGEELLIYRACALHSEGPMLSRGALKKTLHTHVSDRIGAGTLRRGSRYLGTVEQVNLAGFGKLPGLLVYDDRLVLGETCRLLDGQVSAAVECDGQVLVHHRPTMTRMAAGAVLPGSALLVGMATAKKETQDTRSAQFIVVHPEWRLSIPISPDGLREPRAVAAHVNKIADAKGTAKDGSNDKLDRLERLAALQASGTITDAEAERLRKEILS